MSSALERAGCGRRSPTSRRPSKTSSPRVTGSHTGLTIRGTHQAAFQGILPTGRRVTVAFTAIVRVEDGKLVEEWGGLDLFDLRRQIEAVVTAGPDGR